MLLWVFFFFKQKTAYEMLRSLVGSEMCIRDRSGASAAVASLGAGTRASHSLESWMTVPVRSMLVLSLIHI